MGGLTKEYIVQRVSMWLLTIWIGVTLTFLIPRLGKGDPVSVILNRMMMSQGYVENATEIIESYKERFGLNDPLLVQYIRYLGNVIRFDYGYSLTRFPITAWAIVKPALPWTLGLLTVASVLSFLIGITIGALMGWRKTPGWLQSILPVSLTFTSIPFFMFGILMIYVFAFQLKILPPTGGYSPRCGPGLEFAVHHRCRQACHFTVIVRHLGFDGRLGFRHARLDDRSEQRRLFLTGPGKGSLTLARFLPLWHAQCDPAGPDCLCPGLGRSDRRLCPGGMGLCLSRNGICLIPLHHCPGLRRHADHLQPDHHHHRHRGALYRSFVSNHRSTHHFQEKLCFLISISGILRGNMAIAEKTNPETKARRKLNIWDSPWLNSKFMIGCGIILFITLFGLLGPLFWDTELAYTASSPTNLPPMWMEKGAPEHPLGTESNGRDMLAQLDRRRSFFFEGGRAGSCDRHGHRGGTGLHRRLHGRLGRSFDPHLGELGHRSSPAWRC